MRILILFATISILGNAQWYSHEDSHNRLVHSLLDIRHARTGDDIRSLEEKERKSLALLEAHHSDLDKGRIYSSIALIYSAHGWFGPEIGAKAAKYCEEALKYPLDVKTAAHIYSYFGDNLIHLENHSSHLAGEALSAHRKKIVRLYLKGLKLIMDNVIQDKAEPLPGVGKYECDGPCPEEEKKHAAQMAERRRIENQNDLVQLRDMLSGNIIGQYSETSTDELEQLAQPILTSAHRKTIDRLLAGIADKKAARERREQAFRSNTKVLKVGRTKQLLKVKDAGSP